MKLDLSKFKKTAEDKHTTTLESPEGHAITVMHTKLPALAREQLKRLKMSEGGSVDSWTKREDNEKGINRNAALPEEGISAAGSQVRWGNVDSAKSSHKRVLSEMKSMPKPNLMASGGRVKMDDGGTVTSDGDSSSDDSSASTPDQSHTTIVNVNPSPGAAQSASAPSSVASEYAQQPVQAQAPQVPANPPSNLNPDGNDESRGGCSERTIRRSPSA